MINTIKKLFKNPFFIGALIGIASLHLFREFSYRMRSAPPAMIEVTPWSLVDHEGKAFGTSELRGKVYIANFFFTQCPSICPRLTQDMKKLHDVFLSKKQKPYFVSFSVDPEHDTPSVLKSYMKKHDIVPDYWSFVTGTKTAMYDVIVEHMKIHVGEKEEIDRETHLYDISHLAQFALFDQKGDLRGLFETSSVGLAQLERAASFLMERS